MHNCSKILFSLFFLFTFLSIHAQRPQMPAGMQDQPAGQLQNTGRVYGKIVDSTGNAIAAATINIFRVVYDSARQQDRNLLVTTSVANNSGNFSIPGLPLLQNLAMEVSAIGYDLKRTENIRMTPANEEINLYSIALVRNETSLNDVVVTSTAKQFFEMGVDRKIFNVENNVITQGQTATEVMKQIPSVNVDVDGNVTVRNAAPQIFIDGRPTTLTLDQIPADIIQTVELVTNPGAKYDASGGGAGILNIVLKKNRRIGYNGGISAGFDTKGEYNVNGDFNVRQGKFNVFARGAYRTRTGYNDTRTERDNRNDTLIAQYGRVNRDGGFKFFNIGTDYFLNDNNTFTISGTYVAGDFNNKNNLYVDSLRGSTPYAYNKVLSTGLRGFDNWGGQFNYRHNFDTSTHFITFDANYNKSDFHGNSTINTGVFSDPAYSVPRRPGILQYNNSGAVNERSTFQVDYENLIKTNSKFGAGLRADFTDLNNSNLQYADSSGRGGSYFVFQPRISNRYQYNDRVLAAYTTYSSKFGDKLTYQLGLRAESSRYKATNNTFDINGNDVPVSFAIEYPISLFPSAFLTYSLSQSQDLQVNYSRRINRPNFFQMLPTPDLSDPYNVTIGNPGLRPEFTNSFEVSYNKTYKNRGNFLASAYWRNTNNQIIGYQYRDTTISLSPITTYLNASQSNTYGLELTNKVSALKIWDITANLNLFYTSLKSNLVANPFTNERFSWFAKLNNDIKLPKGITLQISGDYQSKTVLPVGGGNNFNRGGPGSNTGTAQGYILPRIDIDAAIKKDWRFKNNNTLSVSAAISDIFASDKNKTYSETPFMIQNTYNLRQPQIVRFNISYRFGRMDRNIFNRKSRGIQNDGGGMGED